MSGNHKTPPSFKKGDDYAKWKQKLQIWQNFTSLPKDKQGGAVFMVLEEEAQDAVLELNSEVLATDDGVKNILKSLDGLYEKDKTLSAFEALEEFENYKRPANMSIKDFCNQFDLLYSKTKKYGTEMSTDVLAYRLLKSSNLTQSQQELAKATITTLNFDAMKAHLKKVHVDVEVKEVIKEEIEEPEDLLYTGFRGSQWSSRGNYRGNSGNGNYRGNSNSGSYRGNSGSSFRGNSGSSFRGNGSGSFRGNSGNGSFRGNSGSGSFRGNSQT